MAEPVILFTDYACPWCYLGWARLRTVMADDERGVKFVHFPLNPDTPEEGRDAETFLRAKGVNVAEAAARLAGMLAAEGLPFPSTYHDRRLYNTARAQELALWAETQPDGDRIHERLFQAYHVENIDVNDVEVLLGIVEEMGWDVDAARAVLAARSFAHKREAHWELARRSGVSAVPTFVIGRRGVVGAQPKEILQQLLS